MIGRLGNYLSANFFCKKSDPKDINQMSSDVQTVYISDASKSDQKDINQMASDVQEFFISAEAPLETFLSDLEAYKDKLETNGNISTLKLGAGEQSVELINRHFNQYQHKVLKWCECIMEMMSNNKLPNVTKFDFSVYPFKGREYKITELTLETIFGTLNSWHALNKMYPNKMSLNQMSLKNILNIDLSGNELRYIKEEILLNIARSCRNIQSIDLSGNKFRAIGADILLQIARSCRNIQSIDLRGNDMDWQISMKEALSINRDYHKCEVICDGLHLQLLSESEFRHKGNKKDGELAIDKEEKILMVYRGEIKTYKAIKELDSLIVDIDKGDSIQYDNLVPLFEGRTRLGKAMYTLYD